MKQAVIRRLSHTSVSYTHLDVYKRQELERELYELGLRDFVSQRKDMMDFMAS